jgi:hypothetical protein
MDRGGDEAEKLQRDAGGVFELVGFICGDVKDIAGLERLFAAIAKDRAFTGKHQDFVLIVVLVAGRTAARGNDEFAHGEIGAAITGAAQELHLHLFGASHGDGLFLDLTDVLQDHEHSIQVVDGQ